MKKTRKLLCLVGLSALMLCTTSHAMTNTTSNSGSGENLFQIKYQEETDLVERPEKSRDSFSEEKNPNRKSDSFENTNFFSENFWWLEENERELFSFSGDFLFVGDYNYQFLLLNLNQPNGETLLLRLDPSYYWVEPISRKNSVEMD